MLIKLLKKYFVTEMKGVRTTLMSFPQGLGTNVKEVWASWDPKSVSSEIKIVQRFYFWGQFGWTGQKPNLYTGCFF